MGQQPVVTEKNAGGDDRIVRLLRLVLRRLDRIERRPSVVVNTVPMATPLTAVPAAPVQARHSPDYRTVHWCGVEHHFTPNQAAVVKNLWDAWESGTPEMSQAALLEAANSQQNRLSHVFRNHKGLLHMAWDTMIVSPRKGIYRLDDAD